MCSLQYRPHMDHFQNPKNGEWRPKAAAPDFSFSYHGPYVACTEAVHGLCTAYVWPVYGLCMTYILWLTYVNRR